MQQGIAAIGKAEGGKRRPPANRSGARAGLGSTGGAMGQTPGGCVDGDADGRRGRARGGRRATEAALGGRAGGARTAAGRAAHCGRTLEHTGHSTPSRSESAAVLASRAFGRLQRAGTGGLLESLASGGGGGVGRGARQGGQGKQEQEQQPRGGGDAERLGVEGRAQTGFVDEEAASDNKLSSAPSRRAQGPRRVCSGALYVHRCSRRARDCCPWAACGASTGTLVPWTSHTAVTSPPPSCPPTTVTRTAYI